LVVEEVVRQVMGVLVAVVEVLVVIVLLLDFLWRQLQLVV
jgi:hypothetical protein